MSQKARFFRGVEALARDPARGDVLPRLVEDWEPVLEAFKAGDCERGRELAGDLEARSLLRQALPGWDWRDKGV